MLNIISNEYFKSKGMVSGPLKVFRNLIKGLDIIKYPYVINGDLEVCNKLWIYNDPLAIKKIRGMNDNIKILLGPGFFLDRCLDQSTRNILKKKSKQIVCLQPSEWSKEMLFDFGYTHTPIESWPAGIDTEEFTPNFSDTRDVVLVYFKQRYEYELNDVKNTLVKNHIKYEVVIYGQYKEIDYKNLLRKTKYIIWVGRQESQGIALQEALSKNVPILVWDVKKIGHWSPPPKDVNIFTKEESEYDKATAAPYFDDRCGAKFYDPEELEGKVLYMENNFINFKPREYILENLSLEKQARRFLQIFDKYWGLKVEDGYKERLLTYKKWKNEVLWKFIAKIYYFFH